MERKLYKSSDNKMVDGVCAGLAKYMDMDVTVVRMLWLLLTAVGFSGIFLYIICSIVMPREPYTDAMV